MLNGIKRLSMVIVILLLLSLPIFSGCATVKPHYFNDSDKIAVGKAKERPPIPEFDWVLMSQGMYRKITTANPINN